MDDSKVGLNLGGGGKISLSITNIKRDILGLASSITGTLQPAVDKLVKSLNSVKIPKVEAPSGSGQGGSGVNNNVVASNGRAALPPPPPDNGSGTGGGGGWDKNRVAAVNEGFQKYVSASSAISSGLEASKLMPSVPTAVMQDLLTVRSAFYGQGGFNGSLQQQSANVKALQKSLAHNGLATDAMDTTNALATANDLGLSGATNFSSVMQGAAQASRFTPGIGITGATQAIGQTLNAPSTVNMARVIGIQLRGPDGSLLPLDQVVDKIWNFLKQQGRGTPSKKDIQISLMPGNGIYNMLSGLFNGDTAMIQMVGNMLLAKAQFGGAELSSLTTKQLVKAGIQSQTAADIGRQTATQTDLTVDQSSKISGGYDVSTKFNNAVDKFVSGVDTLTGGIGAINGLNQGLLGGPLGSLGGTISKLLRLFGLAEGGPAINKGPIGDGKTPYIVGEEGPELFIPQVDGQIIPNHKLPGLNRNDGVGKVKSTGGSAQEIQQYLMKTLGISADAATGVVGNLMIESGLDTRAEGDKNAKTGKYTSYGIAQWHEGRWDNLRKYAAKIHADPWSITAQEGFLAQEIKTTGDKFSKGTLLDQLKAKGITEGNAAAYFMSDFERPNDQSQSAAQKRANAGVKAIKGNYSPAVTGGYDPNSMPGGPQSGGSTYTGSGVPSATSAALTAADIGTQRAAALQSGGTNYGGLTFNFNGITDTTTIVTKVKQLINNPTGTVGKG
jgi:Phage tail lysozyme